ncbi:hypothetical protein GE21DRAFT_10660 [Neurospora crassa]|uniref:Uncharacterized protein n=1 Tax=Neurospora crassa (strain ATCC 24698 / 74-OR23-1A / CBS 708.71 / DSM 1257 / FGSC 987) TaxID=367110 RepID=V5ILQ9_NEUCR|nr:hypothetical protein NCU17274 [Neurospora crassa OR74A]ESA42054.1 hypothetical protein NCU17274 [Neurospora crassa OR74A]KHE86625.1 hypothetical protein GE21DRAFT_10660 [Neurospora crassa]|eukprot:XP_011395393.1 hypothetical protein NCU17274 [Neurospora crassa OR74A]
MNLKLDNDKGTASVERVMDQCGIFQAGPGLNQGEMECPARGFWIYNFKPVIAPNCSSTVESMKQFPSKSRRRYTLGLEAIFNSILLDECHRESIVTNSLPPIHFDSIDHLFNLPSAPARDAVQHVQSYNCTTRPVRSAHTFPSSSSCRASGARCGGWSGVTESAEHCSEGV